MTYGITSVKNTQAQTANANTSNTSYSDAQLRAACEKVVGTLHGNIAKVMEKIGFEFLSKTGSRNNGEEVWGSKTSSLTATLSIENGSVVEVNFGKK